MSITKEGFIKVDITEEMLEAAAFKAKDLGILRNSIRSGGGNLAGFLGEEIVLNAFPGSTSDNTYQHDITFEGCRFEVKSKDRTVNPQLDYEASVANYNAKQKADFYVFTSIFRDKVSNKYTHGHVIGMIPTQDYKAKATYLNVGDIDPSNGWVVKAACFNLPYSELSRFN